MIGKRIRLLALCASALMLLPACTSSADATTPSPSPMATAQAELDWGQNKLDRGQDNVPVINVFVVDKGAKEALNLENYVEGVLAGEMKNDWPLEALKAQAILARTFVLKFVTEKESRFSGADISTDIEEAQAYSAKDVNDRVKQAVKETSGQVLVSGDELPYTWFHAHSGGMTALAKEGLGYEKDEPAYTKVAQSEGETTDPDVPDDAKTWQATFTFPEFAAACEKQGKHVTLNESSRITVGDRGQSGRALTLLAADQTIDVPQLRIALGSTKMRSTLLTSVKATAKGIEMAGKGYGHGVGMSQWGAYVMAKNGKTAEEIVKHYFQNVELTKLW